MKRMHWILAAVAMLAGGRVATACGYGMPSPAARFALANIVLVGKVTAIESRKLPLRQQRGGDALPHVVEVIKVENALKGDERWTHVRLAVLPHQVMPVGYEGCFFLTAHAEEMVFTLSSRTFDYPIQKENNPGFVQQVEELKKMSRLLRDPAAGLTSKSADERFLTAALLVSVHRTFQPEIHQAAEKKEAIDPVLSKLILKVLAESDWNRNVADFRLNGQRVFNMIGATEKDGWKPQGGDRVAEAKRWLTDNAGTFRIKGFVRR